MCPDPLELDALARGELGERDRARVLSHVDGCASCASVVAELARMRSTALSTPSVGFASGDASLAGANIGRFQIGKKLGSGGMGTVFEAYDPELARQVAIKVLHPENDGDLEIVRALLVREAQAMARLNHPNVVAVFDVGTTGHQLFLAMELVSGTTLADWLKSKARTRVEIVDAFVQAGRGLVAAHAAGLVHRDFKPANVLVGDDGRVRVSDFGLARNPARRATMGNGALETQAGLVFGTPAYMSPEQWRGQQADARSDQWSYGVALYEALVGRHPFEGATRDALRDAALSDKPIPIPDDLPRTVRRTLGRALEKMPESRYPTMAGLLGDLDVPRASLVRRMLPVLALVLGGGAFVGAVVVAWPRGGDRAKASPPTACAKAADSLDGVWSASIEGRVSEKLPKESPLVERLAAYANEWRSMRAGVCEAALRKELSDDLRDKRNACLDRRLHALDGVVQIIEQGTPDPSSVVRGLPLIADCADQTRVETSIFLPSDPDERKKVEEIESDIEEARVLTNAHQLAKAEPIVERALEAATRLGFDPAIAEAQYRRASLLEDRTDYPAAEKGFKEAFATARAARHDEVMRNSAIALVRVIGTEEARPADADEWIKSARAEVKRAETDGSAKTRLMENEADVDLTAGRYQDAKGKLAEVLHLREASLPANDPDLGVAHWNLGAALERLHEYDAALVERTKAFDVMRAAYGEDSPMAANYARGVADIQYRLGKYDEARATYEKALETYAHFADVESDVSTTHEQLARVLRAMKQPALAVDEMNKSISIREKLVGPNHPFVAGELKNLADALDDVGRSTEALSALERASNIMANAYGKDSPEGADITCARADVTSNLGHQDEAIVLYEKAIDDVARALGPNDPKIGRYAFNLGLARKKKGDFAGAASAYEQAATVFEAAYGSDARETKLARLALDEAKKRAAK